MSAMIAIKSEPAAIKSEPPSGDMDTSMSFNGSGGASESQPHVKDGSNQGKMLCAQGLKRVSELRLNS